MAVKAEKFIAAKHVPSPSSSSTLPAITTSKTKKNLALSPTALRATPQEPKNHHHDNSPSHKPVSPPHPARPSSSCQKALLLPEILTRILFFVPLWIPTYPHQPLKEVTFNPTDMLACSLVSKIWREPALQLLFLIHHSQHQKVFFSKPTIVSHSERYRVFIDSQDFWTADFECLQNLVVMDVQCGIGREQMLEVLRRSPRLEELTWNQVESVRRENFLPEEHLRAIMGLSRLKLLVLDNWEFEWVDLVELMRSKPNLRTLGLGSSSYWQNKLIPFAPKDLEGWILPVEDLRLKLLWTDPADASMDLVQFMPHLRHLTIDVLTAFDKARLADHLHRARARLAHTTGSSVIPLSKLESLEIHVQSTFEPIEVDQLMYLTTEEITAFLECAQPDGITRLHLDVANVSPALTDAIRATPLTSTLGYSILQDLEIQITDFYGHPTDPIPWLRTILTTCTRLRRVHFDLTGPLAQTKVYMRFAMELFCGENEQGGMDRTRAWGCAETLEDLTVMGIRKASELDFAGYLGWRYQKSSSARRKKFWRGNKQRLHNLFSRGGSSSTSYTSSYNNHYNNVTSNNANNEDETSSSSEEEQPMESKVSVTRVIAFEIYEQLKSIGRDPDVIYPDDLDYMDRLMRFACPGSSSTSTSDTPTTTTEEKKHNQHQQQQQQQEKPRLTHAEKRFNAQLAAQLAQCPKLVRLRLNFHNCSQELADLRARQRELKMEEEAVFARQRELLVRDKSRNERKGALRQKRLSIFGIHA
ncbi:hypothetical protein BGW39_004781 [Mortierella sp. 14UC]|nr:hypothetical protein BGW39_004781 [Mortierella sp. 14UC]